MFAKKAPERSLIAVTRPLSDRMKAPPTKHFGVLVTFIKVAGGWGLLLLSDVALIGRGIHQARGIGGIFDAEFEDPSFAVGVGVDERRVGFDSVVGFDHFAADRGVDVGGGFHGFDHRGRIAGVDLAAECGEFDKDHIGEFGLGVIRDAHGGDVAFESDPFVRGAVAEVGGDVHGMVGVRGARILKSDWDS